ncbi:MAG: DJ-1 family glyoxalase III [Acutalibacteraceae bacterium]|jgi:4-methyl-5(b-hydroxyethyl)-thiazole monophosphate biosynthesis
MVYLFLAEGFEESEALVPLDILRRGEISVKTVGVTSEYVTGSHGICVKADILIDNIIMDDNLQAIILPGGMPGTVNLEKSGAVQAVIDFAAQNGKLIAAICAAPMILGHKNLLNGKTATCFPGFEKDLFGADVVKSPVVKDGSIITARGAGTAFEFGFEILSYLADKSTSDNLKRQMQYTCGN